MDQLVASTAAMVAALYVLASAVLWYMVINKGKLHNRSIVTDRAVAWTAFALLFAINAGIKMRWYVLNDVPDFLMLFINVSVATAGLFSVREMTRARFGSKVLLLFAVVMLATALTLWAMR